MFLSLSLPLPLCLKIKCCKLLVCESQHTGASAIFSATQGSLGWWQVVEPQVTHLGARLHSKSFSVVYYPRDLGTSQSFQEPHCKREGMEKEEDIYLVLKIIQQYHNNIKLT